MQQIKIFVISLKSDIARREKLKPQLEYLHKTFGIEFCLFDAIDLRGGRGSEDNQMIQKHYSSFFAKLYRKKDLALGELGCFASHYSLWLECLQVNHPIIILEDDIEILPNFYEALDSISKSGFSYVRLMALQQNSSIKYLDEHFTLFQGYVYGAQGYYLTPEAACNFIACAKKWVEPVDDYLDRYWKHKIPNIMYSPNPIRENEFSSQSNIGSSRYKKSKTPVHFKLSRECIKAYNRLYKFFYDAFILSRLFVK